MKHSSLLRSNLGLTEAISTVILTSVMIVIIISASYYANDTLSYNVENVQFDQAINAVLSLERMAKKMMFNPQSAGSVKTSFVTTCPYITQEGTLVVLIDQIEIASFPANSFKIQGSQSVGVSYDYYYVGHNDDPLILVGLNGSISHVKKYQDQGAWISLDFNRIRCLYNGEISYYGGVVPEQKNMVEITIVKLSSGELSPLERSRIILETKGITTHQLEFSGDFTITVEFSGVEYSSSLSSLGGNATLSTVINLAIINLEITVLGG